MGPMMGGREGRVGGEEGGIQYICAYTVRLLAKHDLKGAFGLASAFAVA